MYVFPKSQRITYHVQAIKRLTPYKGSSYYLILVDMHIQRSLRPTPVNYHVCLNILYPSYVWDYILCVRE